MAKGHHPLSKMVYVQFLGVRITFNFLRIGERSPRPIVGMLDHSGLLL